MTDKIEYVCPMVYSQYPPWYVNIKYDAPGHLSLIMGHPMKEIRVLVKGHDELSNMVDLRDTGESLMNLTENLEDH